MNLFRHFLWHLHLRVVPRRFICFIILWFISVSIVMSVMRRLFSTLDQECRHCTGGHGNSLQFYISVSLFRLPGSMPSTQQNNHPRKLWHTRHDWTTVGNSIYNNFDQTRTRPYYITLQHGACVCISTLQPLLWRDQWWLNRINRIVLNKGTIDNWRQFMYWSPLSVHPFIICRVECRTSQDGWVLKRSGRLNKTWPLIEMLSMKSCFADVQL